MRQHKKKNRSKAKRPFEIDVMVPGLAAATGRKDDRFRCSGETRAAKLLEQRREMIHDLGRRLLFDVLAGRLEGRFTTELVEISYKQGAAALTALVAESQRQLLEPLLSRWMTVCSARNKADYQRQILSFVALHGGPQNATVADLTAEKIAIWLGSLTDSRRGSAGAPRRSNSASAVVNRNYRAKRRDRSTPRSVSSGTRNRYRTAMSAFCTYLVNTAAAMPVHPIRAGRLKGEAEQQPRMPDIDSDTWNSYCAALADDPLAPTESVLIARILRHTGADVGEVLGLETENGTKAGLQVIDIKAKPQLTRIRFKRQKVTTSPERFVPFPDEFVADLMGYIAKNKLRASDLVFASVDRSAFEAAHRRARKKVGKTDLRLKDLRHLAAISWAKAGARLERIKEWLGHSSIRQTEVYARFAPDDEFDAPVVARAATIATGAKPLRITEAA